MVLMCEKEPQLKIAQELALDFNRILKTKNKPQLSRWFTHVSESGPVELKRVAAGMEADAAAVCEAITSKWSNGVVEGHVNRLKMLKRQMYGRAGFELLRTGDESSGLKGSALVAEDPNYCCC